MNKLMDCFDPVLQSVFCKETDTSAFNHRQDSSQLFYHLIQIGEHYDQVPLAYHYLKQQFLQICDQYQDKLCSEYQSDNMGSAFKTPLLDRGVLTINLSDCLQQCSPVILTEPCWLQTISQAATSQYPIAVKLMAMYLSLTQVNLTEVYTRYYC
ncbi:MAG: hypothetical protein ACXWT3_10355 [Methylococcaceae bacterium]